MLRAGLAAALLSLCGVASGGSAPVPSGAAPLRSRGMPLDYDAVIARTLARAAAVREG